MHNECAEGDGADAFAVSPAAEMSAARPRYQHDRAASEMESTQDAPPRHERRYHGYRLVTLD